MGEPDENHYDNYVGDNDHVSVKLVDSIRHLDKVVYNEDYGDAHHQEHNCTMLVLVMLGDLVSLFTALLAVNILHHVRNVVDK